VPRYGAGADTCLRGGSLEIVTFNEQGQQAGFMGRQAVIGEPAGGFPGIAESPAAPPPATWERRQPGL
jgi:hypothetical protein